MRLNIVRALHVMKLEPLQDVMDEIRNSLAEKVTKDRDYHILHHNKKSNPAAPNFALGDFVLVHRSQDKGHKFSFRWVGPRNLTRVMSEMICDVTNMVRNKTDLMHVARLLLYRAQKDGSVVSENLIEHVKQTEANFEIIEKLLDIGEASDGILVQVRWVGWVAR